MFHDSELAAGFQDADLEMAGLEAAGNRSAALRRKGICDHGWLNAPYGEPAVCNDCGKVFPNAEAAYAEGRAIRNGEDD